MANGEYPPNYTEAVGKVRILIPDADTDTGDVNGDYLFSDEQIESILGLYNDSIKRATAALIDTIANDQALLYKVVRTDDLSVNGAQVADALRKRAQSLRDEANNDDDGDLEDAVQIVYPATGGFIPEGTMPVYGREWVVGRWR
jgi:hypothetical protein